jgi:hypothetical protein
VTTDLQCSQLSKEAYFYSVHHYSLPSSLTRSIRVRTTHYYVKMLQDKWVLFQSLRGPFSSTIPGVINNTWLFFYY